MYLTLKYISTVIAPSYWSILKSQNFFNRAGVFAEHIRVWTRGLDSFSSELILTELTIVIKAWDGYSELAWSICFLRLNISS